MTRVFWTAWPVAMLVWTGFLLAPYAETNLAPVRIDQTVTDITRSGTRMCWTWTSTKVRDLVSDDVDVYVHAAGQRSVGYVFREADRLPWSAPGATRLGVTLQRWCTILPPSIEGRDHVRIEWRAWYPAVLPWSRFPLRLPDVVSPGA